MAQDFSTKELLSFGRITGEQGVCDGWFIFIQQAANGDESLRIIDLLHAAKVDDSFDLALILVYHSLQAVCLHIFHNGFPFEMETVEADSIQISSKGANVIKRSIDILMQVLKDELSPIYERFRIVDVLKRF